VLSVAFTRRHQVERSSAPTRRVSTGKPLRSTIPIAVHFLSFLASSHTATCPMTSNSDSRDTKLERMTFSELDEAHQHMGTEEANDGLLECLPSYLFQLETPNVPRPVICNLQKISHPQSALHSPCGHLVMQHASVFIPART
jgi:hypothetical protein